MEKNIEVRMTEIYTQNEWGCPESRSGPTSTLERTQELREKLSELFQTLGIETIVDIGCGDWSWIQHVNLDSIQYLGIDIVTPLIEKLQNTYTKSNVKFQKMDVLQEPPETGDLWLCRDFLNILSLQQVSQFFPKFLESKTPYLALTTIETNEGSSDGTTGIQRSLDLFQPPFLMPEPLHTLLDGCQWFRPHLLLVFERTDIEQWWEHAQHRFKQTTLAVEPRNKVADTQGTISPLQSNILLKNYPIRAHMG